MLCVRVVYVKEAFCAVRVGFVKCVYVSCYMCCMCHAMRVYVVSECLAGKSVLSADLETVVKPDLRASFAMSERWLLIWIWSFRIPNASLTANLLLTRSNQGF